MKKGITITVEMGEDHGIKEMDMKIKQLTGVELMSIGISLLKTIVDEQVKDVSEESAKIIRGSVMQTVEESLNR